MVLVGAGPAGIAAAVTFRRAGLRFLHLEGGRLAQTIANFPAGIRLYSSRGELEIDGVPFDSRPEESPSREAYLQYLQAVCEERQLRVGTHTVALSVTPGDHAHQLRARNRDGSPRVIVTRNIAVASGGYYRPVLLGIPGEMLPHVSHYYAGYQDLRQKRVLVVGGRNSAVEAAVELAEHQADVVLAYRGARLPRSQIKPWLLPRLAEQRRRGHLDIRYRTVPLAIEPGRAALLSRGAHEERLDADRVLLLTGYGPDYALLSRAGVPVHRRTGRPLHHPRTLETHVEGIFLCGTVVLKWQGEKASISNTRNHGEVILDNMR